MLTRPENTGISKGYADDRYFWKVDEATTTVDIYIETTGDDNTGDGSVAKPYATIQRAFRDIPLKTKEQRRIYLGAGTFDIDRDVHWTSYFGRHEMYGTTSVEASQTIDVVVAADDADGLQLQSTGAGWTPDEHVGKHITWTSGNYNGQYGVIYHNTADTIFVSHSVNIGSIDIYGTVPTAGDTYDILSLDTTINLDKAGSGTNVGFKDSRFLIQECNITGDTLSIQTSLLYTLRCNIQNAAFNGSNASFLWVETCYIKNTGSILAMNFQNTATKYMDGTVLDGGGTNGMFTRDQCTVKLSGEVVFANLDNNGICTLGSFYQAERYDALLRWYDCAAGFIHGWWNAKEASAIESNAANLFNLPKMVGNITGNFLMDLRQGDTAILDDNTAVTTALGTNICTTNGTSESYVDDTEGTVIYGLDEVGVVERRDPETTDVTIYVETTGDDDTGNGSSANPYATIERAYRDIPIHAEHRRTIQLGSGTFKFPENFTHAFAGNGHFITGTTQAGTSYAVSSINTSSRDDGLIISATAPGWIPSSLIGKHIKWTSGSLNNTYGVIYENTADTIYVSNAKAGAWTNPSVSDTFEFHDLLTTINNNVTSPDRIGIQFNYLVFQDLKLSGGYQGVGYSTIAYNRCHLNMEQAAIGAYSRGVFWTSYISELNILPGNNLITTGDNCRFEVDYGTVLDGQARSYVQLLANSYLTIGHDVVFARLNSSGIRLDSNCRIYRNSESEYLTMRWLDCAGGIKTGEDEGDITIDLPYVAGNITGDFAAILDSNDTTMFFNDGTLTTALGDKVCTVNSTSESYINDINKTIIYGVQDNGWTHRTDTATAAVDIYVDTGGNDKTGNGTATYPYATIDRAFRDIPVFMEQERNIYLSSGTHTWDGNYTLGFKQARINFYGDTSVQTSWTIQNILTSSRDNGLTLQITGAAFTPNEFKGRIIQFTSGAKNGQYGVVYKNDATTIYCTSSDTSGTWTNPVNGDTIDLITNNSTIDIDGGKRNSIRVMRFYNINFTGGWFQGAMSALTYWYCSCDWQQVSAGPDSVHRNICSYWTSNSGAVVAAAGRDATIRLNRGAVVDGETTKKIELLSAGTVAIADEAVIVGIPSQGWTMATDSRITSDEYDATGNTLRFVDTASGVYVPDGAAGGQVNLPYLAGTITDNYIIEILGDNYKANVDGGTVTTGLGTNTASVDGATESYFEPDRACWIQGLTGSDYFISGNLDQVINGQKIHDLDNLEAWQVRQNGDAGDVVTIDTLNPADAHVNPPEVVSINANGGNAYAGSGNQITVLDVDNEINSGNQTGRTRGVDVLLKYSGNVTQTGVDGSEGRAFNASVSWNSTSTSDQLVGMQNFIACGGGAGITTGLVDEMIGNIARVGYNTNTAGSITDGIGFKVNTPKNVDVNHTITNVYGLKVEDQTGTGITNAWAISTEGGEHSLQGGMTMKRTATATDYNILQDDYIIGVTDTTAPRSITLPTGISAGKTYIIKDESGGAAANNITINVSGAVTIDGAGSQTIATNYGSISVYSDGTNWFTF